MKISGSHSLKASKERVWFVLTDRESLKVAIPGCEELNEISPDCFESVLGVGVAGIKGRYTGRVHLDQKVVYESFRITVDGRGAPGFVRGVGAIRLQETAEGTQVDYSGDLQIGGTIAAVGQRLVQSAARILIGQFFATLARIAEAES